MSPFGDRLAAAVAARESQLVLGVDPDPARLWPSAAARVPDAQARMVGALAAAGDAAAALADAPARAEAVAPAGTAARLGDERMRVEAVAPAATAARLGDERMRVEAGAPAATVARLGDERTRVEAGAHAATAARLGDERTRVEAGGPDATAGRLGDTPADALAGASTAAAADPRTTSAARVLAHCLALVDAAGPACVAVKPQLACFERLGAGGWIAYEALVAHARAAGLLVIADGKRGDVPVSATAYARAYFSESPVAPDALTVNPLLGRDALAPLAGAAVAGGAGLFVLVRTSNPGAADLMDLALASGEPLWERIAAHVDALGMETRGPASGLSAVGAVTGATEPRHLARMRELMPATPFLLPGIGAQGGRVEDVAPAFAPGRAGGLVTASRSIADAHTKDGGDPAAAARAEAERLRAAAWALT